MQTTEIHVQKHILCLKLFEVLIGVDDKVLCEIPRQGVSPLVLILRVGRLSWRTRFRVELLHLNLEEVHDRCESLQSPLARCTRIGDG
jgi:hypothetical protein